MIRVSNGLNVIQRLVPSEKYGVKCPYAMTPQFIVVHNTYNDATARSEINYMVSNDNQTSFHYAIDDKEIVQGIPENRNAFQAGDGANGKGNRQGIGIEICYSKSGGERFIKAERLAAKFIACKLIERGWGIEKVTKHQDYSGKYCPHRTLDMGWQRFLDMIKKEMEDNIMSNDNMTLDEALKVLKANGLISNTEPWKTTIETGKHMETLILNVAQKLK